MMLGLWLSRSGAVVEPGRAEAHDAGLVVVPRWWSLAVLMFMMLGLWLSRSAAVVEPGRADAHDAGLVVVS